MGDKKEIVLFYNTENFFAPDAVPNGEIRTKQSGLLNWNQKRYANKIQKIAHVFELVEEKEGVLPMLIGLSEIQGERVLEDLLQAPVFDGNYQHVHYESLDERGIDVALLYDHNKIEILHSEPITYFFPFDDNEERYDTTRDVLYCRIKYENTILNLFVFHLPSKRENNVNEAKREHIIKDIQKRIHKMIHVDKEATIILGDFNEDPDQPLLKNLEIARNGDRLIFNPFTELFQKEIYSTFHYKEGLLFDQIMLSVDFLDNQFPIEFQKAQVFNDRALSNHDRKFLGRPFRTFAGTRYLGGYSDHFPVFVTLESKS